MMSTIQEGSLNWRKKLIIFKGSLNVDIFLSIKGMIACLRNDLDSMHKHHKNALSYSDNASLPLKQYVVSLKRHGLLEQAYEYAKELIDKDINEIEIAIKIGQFINANDIEHLFELWDNHFPDEDFPLISDDKDLQKFSLDSLDVSSLNENNAYTPVDTEQLDRIEKLVKDVELD